MVQKSRSLNAGAAQRQKQGEPKLKAAQKSGTAPDPLEKIPTPPSGSEGVGIPGFSGWPALQRGKEAPQRRSCFPPFSAEGPPRTWLALPGAALPSSQIPTPLPLARAPRSFSPNWVPVTSRMVTSSPRRKERSPEIGSRPGSLSRPTPRGTKPLWEGQELPQGRRRARPGGPGVALSTSALCLPRAQTGKSLYEGCSFT